MADARKVLVIFGTRPEAIKLFPVINALAATPGIAVRICVTAQHRGLLDQVMTIAALTPDIATAASSLPSRPSRRSRLDSQR